MKKFIKLNFFKAFFFAIFFIGCCTNFCHSKTVPNQLTAEDLNDKILVRGKKTIKDFADLNPDLNQADFVQLQEGFEKLFTEFPGHKFVRFIARKLCAARHCNEQSINILKSMIDRLEEVFEDDLELSIDPIAKRAVLFCRQLKKTFCYFSVDDFFFNDGGSVAWFLGKHLWEIGAVGGIIVSFLAGYYLGNINQKIVFLESDGFGGDYIRRSFLSKEEKDIISIFVNPAKKKKTMEITPIKVPRQSGSTCRECSLAATFLAKGIDQKQKFTPEQMIGTTRVVKNYTNLAKALLKNTSFLKDLTVRQKAEIVSSILSLKEATNPSKRLSEALKDKTTDDQKFIQFLNQNSDFFHGKVIKGFGKIDKKNFLVKLNRAKHMEACIQLLLEHNHKNYIGKMKKIADESFSYHEDDIFVYDQFFLDNIATLISSLIKNKEEQKELKDYIEWIKAKNGTEKPIKLNEDGIDKRALALIRQEAYAGLNELCFVSPIKYEEDGDYGITEEMLKAFRKGEIPICLSFRPNVGYNHFVCAIFRNEGSEAAPTFRIYYMDSLNGSPSKETEDSLLALGRFLTEDNPSLEMDGDTSKLSEIKAALAKPKNNIEGKNDVLIASIESLITSSGKK